MISRVRLRVARGSHAAKTLQANSFMTESPLSDVVWLLLGQAQLLTVLVPFSSMAAVGPFGRVSILSRWRLKQTKLCRSGSEWDELRAKRCTICSRLSLETLRSAGFVASVARRLALCSTKGEYFTKLPQPWGGICM